MNSTCRVATAQTLSSHYLTGPHGIQMAGCHFPAPSTPAQCTVHNMPLTDEGVCPLGKIEKALEEAIATLNCIAAKLDN